MASIWEIIRGLAERKATEHSVDSAWAKLVHRSPVLLGLPEDSLTEMSARMEPIAVAPGEEVIRQGAEGDYFYLIARGKARVTRESPEGPREIAVLGPGSGFGEEALISETVRNATVTMISDGLLMRLHKADFDMLVAKPKLHWTSLLEAQRDVRLGKSVWLDVRSPEHVAKGTMEGAVAVPLTELRDRLDTMARNLKFICICDTGRLSAVAAFLLNQAGFNVAVLRGGIDRLRQLQGLGLASADSFGGITGNPDGSKGETADAPAPQAAKRVIKLRRSTPEESPETP